MAATTRKLFPQPFLGTVSLVAAVLFPLAYGATASSLWRLDPRLIVLAATLVAVLAVTPYFPIHVRPNAKLYVSSVVLYLIAVLLPPEIAVASALVGLAIGELSVRKARGGYYSDVASQVGRMGVVVFGASVVGHLSTHGVEMLSLSLFGAAIVLFCGDVVTGPVLFYPITGEPLWVIMTDYVRQAGLLEGAQYLIGILGAYAAQVEPLTLLLLTLPIGLVYSVAKRTKEMQQTTRELLEHMADTVDLRDPYTGGHSRRVTEYTEGILRELGLSGPDVGLIVSAARVHDIGKIGMPDRVLLKEGPLDDEEWAIMRAHPERGADLLQRYRDFSRGVEIVRHHHEAWDGSGYPHHLKGKEIPFGARVIAVADSFDAMTSDRPYRRGMPVQRAVGILREGRGVQWDAPIVDAFIRSIADRLDEPEEPPLRIVPDPPRERNSTATA